MEALTLIQTGRMERMPVILFGKAFWDGLIDFGFLAQEGTIAPEDVDLISYAETAEEGWEIIRAFYDLP